MSDRRNESKSIKALTALSAALILLDVAAAGYFIVRGVRSRNSSDGEEITFSETETTTTAMPETTTEAVTEPTTEPKDDIDILMEGMSLHDKVCQMFIVRPEALTNGYDVTVASTMTRDALGEYPVCGLIYFEKNLESQTQITNVINTVSDYAAMKGCIPLFYSVDEEGGQVARCADAIGTAFLDSMYYYRSMGTDAAYSNARMIAGDIGGLGFNLDFAPVADTWSNPDNTVIGTRAYSDDFKETADLVSAAVKGFGDGGVYCTLKHFPGHGDTAEDSHYSSAVSYRTADELRNNEYLAFKSGIEAGADLVMVGHIIVPEIDSLPSSLSEKIVQGELRGYLGYEGVIITDSLDMGAIANNYSSADAAVMAVQAGNDILLTPDDLFEAVDGIEAAVASGRITEERINESVRRILELKNKRMDIVHSVE